MTNEEAQLRARYKREMDFIHKMVMLAGLTSFKEILSGRPTPKKVPRKLAVDTLLRLDVIGALEKRLRPNDSDPCPECGGDHPPYRDEIFPRLREFVTESSMEQIECSVCYDTGFVHVPVGDCVLTTESDNHAHIEVCGDCDIGMQLDRGDEDFEWGDGMHPLAVEAHKQQCGCDFFVGDCNYHNKQPKQQGTVTGRLSSATLNPSQPPRPALPAPASSSSSEDKNMGNLKAAPKTELEDQLEKFPNVSIKKTGPGDLPIITLPDGMSYEGAMHWLRKKKEDEEKEIKIDHKFPGYYPPDAALALHKAIERTWGFASQEGTPTFFSIIPPAKIGIEQSLDDVIQIPWGRLSFHGVEGYVNTQIAFVDGFPVMQLAGVIRKGDSDKIDRLISKTWEILRQESIYRGQAIQVDFSNFHPEDPRFDPMKAPKFIDLRKTSMDDLVFSDDVQEMVTTNLFTPVRHTQACRKAKVPLRRGVLLAGKFGTGKTLTARVVAKLCVENGWTYIYIPTIKQLSLALTFAQNYAPAVIFGEDIDRILDGDRDEEMDNYLNSMDGIDRKNHEVMVVFTTNNVDNIHPGFMRPGRIDAVIPVNPPDGSAMARLLFKYGTGLIDPNADLSRVGELLAGQIPAAARETMERSKLRAIDAASTRADGEVILTAEHLEKAAHEVLEHMKFVNPVKVEPRHPAEVFGSAIADKIGHLLLQGRRHDSMSGQDLQDIRTAGKNGNLAEGLTEVGRQTLRDNPSLNNS
jgi:transitional endoplasmic reticulum ATPase